MPVKNAVLWLWGKIWAWEPLAWIVSTIFVGAAIVLVQEHMYGAGRGLFIAGAFVVLIKLLHDAIVEGKKAPQIVASLVIAGLFFGGVVYAAWRVIDRIEWNHEVIIHMTFKSSPLFTEKRQHKIIWNLNKYCRYLAKLGFEFPTDIPPLELSAPNSFMMGGGSPGPAYFSSLMIPENTVDNPDTLRLDYSFYIFNRSLVWPDDYKTPRAQKEDDEESVSIFACYFPASFSGHLVCANEMPAHKWIDALWELRKEYGKDNIDQLLYYTFVTWTSFPPKNSDNFDSFFRSHLMSGGIVKGILGIEPILKRHSIDITPP
jgi:hypothetical protein